MYEYRAEKILMALLQFTNEQLSEFIDHEAVQGRPNAGSLTQLGQLTEDRHQEAL